MYEKFSAAEIFELGIRFEKDSILFFEGMKKTVSKREQCHLIKLNDLRKIL